jgi:hypothetical protein
MRKWSLISCGLAALALALSLGAQALRSGILASPRGPEATFDTGTPKVVLQESKHDFGILDPREPCRHLFVLRNEGTAPLKIAKAGTSCKCTVSVLPKGEIPPGKGGPLEIESKTEEITGKFRHTADFVTNDPAMPRFQLAIEGDIRSYLSASEPAVHFSDLERGKPAQASTVVFSQVWDAFSLPKVRSSIKGLTWDFQPAPPEKLREFNARSGYVATFRLPGSAVSKSFSGWVEAVAEPADHTQNTKTVHLVIAGEVPGLRAVYGPLIDDEGVVTIGALKPGEGARVCLVLKVRGEHREIRVRNIEKSPGFLNVSVAPTTPELAKKGLYRIVLEVPREAPACNHMVPGGMGDIRVLTDHPEMPEIVRLKIAFAVTSG